MSCLFIRWKNSKIRAKPLNWVQIERKRHDKVSIAYMKNILLQHLHYQTSLPHIQLSHCGVMIFQERTAEEHKKLVEKVKKRDLKRQKRIEAAGIEYKCPEIVRIKSLVLSRIAAIVLYLTPVCNSLFCYSSFFSILCRSLMISLLQRRRSCV